MRSSRDRISNLRPRRARNFTMTRRSFSPMAIAGSARLRNQSNSTRRIAEVMNVAWTDAFAAYALGSHPPCGGEVERGVSLGLDARGLPPSLTSRASFAHLGPRKGGGNVAAYADRGTA